MKSDISVVVAILCKLIADVQREDYHHSDTVCGNIFFYKNKWSISILY